MTEERASDLDIISGKVSIHLSSAIIQLIVRTLIVSRQQKRAAWWFSYAGVIRTFAMLGYHSEESQTSEYWIGVSQAAALRRRVRCNWSPCSVKQGEPIFSGSGQVVSADVSVDDVRPRLLSFLITASVSFLTINRFGSPKPKHCLPPRSHFPQTGLIPSHLTLRCRLKY